jgi:plastocyanin
MKEPPMNRLTRSLGLSLVTAALVAAPLLAASTRDGEVDQRGLRFTKQDVAIGVGGTMHFHNGDDVIHNIMTIDENDEPEDHGLQKPGEIISATFKKPGAYQVRCAIHPKMKMTVKVGE